MREIETEGQRLRSSLLGEPEEPLGNSWHLVWPVHDSGHLDIEEAHFGSVNKSLQTGKQSFLEGKVCEGQQSGARLKKLVVPGREVLKHSARWLGLLHSEEPLKGVSQGSRVTWPQHHGRLVCQWVRSKSSGQASFLLFFPHLSCTRSPMCCELCLSINSKPIPISSPPWPQL